MAIRLECHRCAADVSARRSYVGDVMLCWSCGDEWDIRLAALTDRHLREFVDEGGRNMRMRPEACSCRSKGLLYTIRSSQPGIYVQRVDVWCRSGGDDIRIGSVACVDQQDDQAVESAVQLGLREVGHKKSPWCIVLEGDEADLTAVEKSG